jgi:hypothetical protein
MNFQYISYCLLLFTAWVTLCFAQPQYQWQNEAPIANFAWDENDTTRYANHYLFERAYSTIESMLTDKRPLDFSEAVFVVENCMYDGTLDHKWYEAELQRITTGIRKMAFSPAITAPTTDMALNYAIFKFYTEPCPLNNNRPYEYDKESFIKEAGFTGGMVTHLLQTGTGTCHSLPYLYKIIADKVGAAAYLANAPLHSYIRTQDANGKWWNFETTTGHFNSPSFIMESFYVSEEAIRSGLYMTNLTAKETIVQCLYDLLCIYERKTGFYSNGFVRMCYTLGLKYHYADNLHCQQINDLKYQLDKRAWNAGIRSEKALREDAVFGKEYEHIQQLRKEFDAMGYHKYTPEEYQRNYQQALDYLTKKSQQQEEKK